VSEDVLDDLDRHLPAAGSLDRAAVLPGMYLAWCANLQLISGRFQQEHESALLRLRYRELTPAEFFTATTGGTLEFTHLSPGGQAFSRIYYPGYVEDCRRLFGTNPYGAKDDWPHYDRIAPVLTRRYMDWKDRGRRGDGNGSVSAGIRRWWQRLRDGNDS
jgi:hypothetical protein